MEPAVGQGKVRFVGADGLTVANELDPGQVAISLGKDSDLDWTSVADLGAHEGTCHSDVDDDITGGRPEDASRVQGLEHVPPVQPVSEGSDVAGSVAVVRAGDQPEAVAPAQSVEGERPVKRPVRLLAEAAWLLVVASAGLEHLD